MSAKCPLICSAVELWYKMMLEIRNQSELAENHIKRKAAGYQRLSSNWLWLFMAAYKPSFSAWKSVKLYALYLFLALIIMPQSSLYYTLSDIIAVAKR